MINKRANLKHLLELGIVLVIIACAISYMQFGSPKYWGNFTGMTETAVIKRLGTPDSDSRKNQNDAAKKVGVYTLRWHPGFSNGLSLELEDGKVISQKRVSR